MVARESHPVVGVAQVRRQRGAVRDGALGMGVPPGVAPADAPVAGGRASRIPRGRVGVVTLVEPVGAPLVAHAREIHDSERVRRRLADARWPVEGAHGPRVAPGIACALEPAARRLLPLCFRRPPLSIASQKFGIGVFSSPCRGTAPRARNACLISGMIILGTDRLLRIGHALLAFQRISALSCKWISYSNPQGSPDCPVVLW